MAAPQTAFQAAECIVSMQRAMSRKRFADALAAMLRADAQGVANWTSDARRVWNAAATVSA